MPIGRALPGYRLYVLDDSGEPLADGNPGELWIGGAGVARGYRGDPLRSAERFRPDPFGEGAMYRTGDRAKVREDGELMFLGRLDDQVKIDGQRVEPGEVERVLAEHPAILESAVLAREDVPGHKRLIAYAVSSSPAPEPARRVLEDMGAKLPAFMAPSALVWLDEMPRNERGKVDRVALPAPQRATPAERSGDRKWPRSRRSSPRCSSSTAWGPTRTSSSSAATSLLAMQLVGRLRERLGVELDIEAVFEARTAAALARQARRGADRRSAAPPLQPGRSAPGPGDLRPAAGLALRP